MTDIETGKVTRDDLARAHDLLALHAELDAIELRRVEVLGAIAHLGGEVRGHDVELAQLHAQGARVEGKVDQVLATLETLASGLLEQAAKVVVLEQRQRQHQVRCDSRHTDAEAL